LQAGGDLGRLLGAVIDEMEMQRGGRARKPVVVKLSPDLGEADLESTVQAAVEAGISGVILTNTTLSREGLSSPQRTQTGGLSGVPLRDRSTAILRRVFGLTKGSLPIVGSGGVFTAADAYEKIRAGASLVEVYTALIYEGPELPGRLCRELSALLRRDGFARVADAVGADHR
jgi:dihydroorotate dehydrogenase